MPQTETKPDCHRIIVATYAQDATPGELAAVGFNIYGALQATLPEEILGPIAMAFIKQHAQRMPEGDAQTVSLALAMLSIDRPCYYGQAARLAAHFDAPAFHALRERNTDPIVRAREETAAGGVSAKQYRGLYAALVTAWQRFCRRQAA